MPNAWLPPVKERVRISARVGERLAAAVDRELQRRGDAGELGGGSLAEFVDHSLVVLTTYEQERLRRAHRAALPISREPQRRHLQPRVSVRVGAEDQGTLDLLVRILRERLGEGRATRRTVIVTALNEAVGRLELPSHALERESTQG